MTTEPNWDKINAQKRLEINLGQSKNQAMNYICAKQLEATEKRYKVLVKEIFKWNCELDDESLNFSEATTKTTYEKVDDKKNKPCPKCQEHIPKGFMFHQKCGWKGE